MRKRGFGTNVAVLAVALACLGTAMESAAEGQWLSLAPLNDPRQELAIAELDGNIYAIGGLRGDVSLADTVEVYDPALDEWQFAAPLPIPLHHPAAASVDGTLYVIGGLQGPGASDAVYAYDPGADMWTPRSPMPTARGALAVAVLGGRIYAAGGFPPARGRDFALYDPVADAWTVLPPMPSSRDHPAAVSIRGRFYAVGGRGGGIEDITAVMEEYDPVRNRWRSVTSMPTARGGIAGAAVNNCLYVFGGEGNPDDPAGVFEENEVYDIRKDVWGAEPPMPTPRHGIGAAVVGSTIYIPGGADMELIGTTGVHEAFLTDRFCDFTLSPPSGTYASVQTFDITLVSEAPAAVAGVTATLDGLNVSPAFSSCLTAGMLDLGGETLRCRVSGSFLAPGVRTFSVSVDLSDGSQRSDTVTWDVLSGTEP